MGLPAAPLVLLLLLRPVSPVPPVPTVPTVSPCSALLPDTSEDLDLTNRSRGCAELDWGPFQRQRRLVLRHNGIAALSAGARLGPAVQELDLAENRLRELPRGFFSHATALRTLRLEGNPLPAVPPAAFQPSLRSLSVSCRCDVLSSVLAPCARAGLRCLCLAPQRPPFNASDFHGRECGPGAGPVAGAAGAAAGVVLVAAVGAAAAVRYRRGRAGAAAGRGKRDPGGKRRQPRYISRDTGIGMGAAAVTDAPDYENILVSPGTAAAAAQGWAPGGQRRRYSPQVLVDQDYFLESDPGAQPIYANTLDPTEDVYIVPDQ